jgi:hypothetical protein
VASNVASFWEPDEQDQVEIASDANFLVIPHGEAVAVSTVEKIRTRLDKQKA